MKKNNKTQGGKRLGSGRKKADYETKTIAFRVRVEFVEPIKNENRISSQKIRSQRLQGCISH